MAVKMTGLDKLNRKLTRLPVEAEKQIRRAMEKGADEIVAMAKSLAPVSANGGGTLRDSIGWTWGNAPKGSMALGSVQQTGGDLKLTIFAGDRDEAFYARWLEFGVAPHTIKSNKVMTDGTNFYGKEVNHPGFSGGQTSFFYPAYRSLKKRVKTRISRAVNDSARKVARGN